MKNGQGSLQPPDHLDYGCELIGEMYGNPHTDAWTNGDFIKLSGILYRKTRVRISPNTLKRIFGKIKTEARYYPQKATRDALAIYIGYNDWEHFVKANPLPSGTGTEVPVPSPVEIIHTPVESPQAAARSYKWLKWATLIAGLGLLATLFFWPEKRTDPATAITLVCKNPVGGNPHSAAFVINGLAAGLNPDTTLILDFGDGRNQSITGVDSLVSHYYEEPGRFYATLKYGSKVLSRVPIYLQSKGWAATATMMYDTTRVYPIELKGLFAGVPNSMSALEMKRAGVDTNRTFFIHFTNTYPSDTDADNFELSIRAKTSADRAGVRCSQIRLIVFGETTRHYIDVMKPGCLHWARMEFSELIREGRHDDLSFLGADLREGGALKLKVFNKQASLFINEKRVFQGSYTKPVKSIYGIYVLFAGVGTIYSLTCKDLKTGRTWEGSF